VARVRTEVDGGAQELLCTLPVVVTTDLRWVLPRPVSLFFSFFSPNSIFYERLNGACGFLFYFIF
jgi:hypothetical protein